MKKVKFTHHGRALYATLCAGILAVGAAAYFGYRSAFGSVTGGIIAPKSEEPLDYSAVDAVLGDVQKTPSSTDAAAPNAAGGAETGDPSTAGAPGATGAAGNDAADSAGGAAGANDAAGANGAAGEGGDSGAAGINNVPGTEGAAPTGEAGAQGNGVQLPESSTEQQADDALRDLTRDLEALYYQEAVVMPINGEIVSAYSGGELVKSTGGVWRTHDGVDIAAEEGAGVKAMTSGTVTDIYSDPLWGNCVVVDHGNTLNGYYFGLADDVSVDIGDRLNAGEVLAKVGNTADIESDLGPHLHFALKYQDKWIDPVEYIEPMK